MKIPINIIPLAEELSDVSDTVVQILNANQEAFKYNLIADAFIVDKLKDYDSLNTEDLYPYFEELRIRIEGYNPYILGITNKRVQNLKYKNLFGDLQKHNGISLGNGVITTYQVKEII